jgi:uncharacterized peroxidase-related enzyme
MAAPKPLTKNEVSHDAIPRPLAKDEVSENLQPIFETLNEKFGRVPNLFAVMANCEHGLATFFPFFARIMHEGKVDPKYKELAYLKASYVNGCEYCVAAHRPMAIDAGLTPKQIRYLHFYKEAEVFDAKERATIKFADMLTRGAVTSSDAFFRELGEFYEPDEIVELALVVCAANMTNMFSTGLLIEPDMGQAV